MFLYIKYTVSLLKKREKIMAYELGAGAIGAGAGLLGIGLNQQGNQQQMQQQQQLMQQQFHNQQALNLQGQQIQQQNWDYTNYGNQVKHMENAGLNVGLMYGMGGGGGQSMGSGGGGSASGGNAPQNTSPQVMGIMADAALKAAQIKLTDAQAEKIKSETPTSGNLGDTGMANTIADTALKTMNAKNAEIQNQIGNRSLEDVLQTIKSNADIAQSQQRSALVKANVDEKTQKSAEEKINAEAINEAFKLGVMKSGIKLNDAQINNMAEQIKIGKFNANTSAEYQSLDRVAGNQLLELIGKIKSMFGMSESNINQIK